MSVKRESGVRRYRRNDLLHKWTQWRTCRGLGSHGKDLYVERNVELMRHPERVHLGDHVIIKSGACICPTNPAAEIRIGAWTTVGYHSYLFATTSISVGDNCLIAPFAYLVDANHGIRREKLIREQDMSAAPISIGDDVWIGTHAVVLKGVTLGQGAVVSAGAVVSENVPEFAIVAGNPARIVGERQ